MIKLLIIVVVLLATKVNCDCSYHCEALDCPCQCYTQEIRCSDKNVTSISRFPSHIHYKYVDFGNNNIQILKPSDFIYRNMRNIHVLQLPANKITKIEDKTFSNLHHLHTLFLNSNQIKDISRNTFVGLNSLNRLYLNNNQISTIGSKTFESCKKTIQLIYLQNNLITHIHTTTFTNLTSLKTLDLSKNNLKALDARFLVSTVNLRHLFLAQNQWMCNKHLMCTTVDSITDKEKNSNLKIHDDLICTDPYRFKDKLVNNIRPEFNCTDFHVTNPIYTKGGENGKEYIKPTLLVLSLCLIIGIITKSC